VQPKVLSIKHQFHKEQKNESQSQKYETSNCTEVGFNPGREQQKCEFFFLQTVSSVMRGDRINMGHEQNFDLNTLRKSEKVNTYTLYKIFVPD
jgi:hypothetical protein